LRAQRYGQGKNYNLRFKKHIVELEIRVHERKYEGGGLLKYTNICTMHPKHVKKCKKIQKNFKNKEF